MTRPTSGGVNAVDDDGMLIEIDAAILVALPLVVRDVGADTLDGLEHVVANIGVQFSTDLEDRESSLVLEVLGVLDLDAGRSVDIVINDVGVL